MKVYGLSKLIILLLIIVLLALTSKLLVDLRYDGITHLLNLLKMIFEIILRGLFLVGSQPRLGIIKCISDGILVTTLKLISKLVFVLNGSSHGIKVVVKCGLGIKSILNGLILVSKLLRVLDHLFDFILRKSGLVVCDCNALCSSGSSLFSCYTEYTVFIDLEGNLDLGDTTGSRRDACQVELAKTMIILDKGSLTFIDCDFDCSLLVLGGGEWLGFLGWNDSASGNNL